VTFLGLEPDGITIQKVTANSKVVRSTVEGGSSSKQRKPSRIQFLRVPGMMSRFDSIFGVFGPQILVCGQGNRQLGTWKGHSSTSVPKNGSKQKRENEGFHPEPSQLPLSDTHGVPLNQMLITPLSAWFARLSQAANHRLPLSALGQAICPPME